VVGGGHRGRERGVSEAGLSDARVLGMGALRGTNFKPRLARPLGRTWGLDADLGEAIDGPARVHVRSTAAWAVGPRTRQARELCELVAERDGLELGPADTVANADDPARHFGRQLDRFTGSWEDIRAAHPGECPRGNSGATTASPRRIRPGRCGVAIYGSNPFGEDPAARPWTPAAVTRVVCRLGSSARGGRERRYGRMGAHPARRTCRGLRSCTGRLAARAVETSRG